jgi:S-adenosylmethionine:tRNA ribosyltransferase-isomerase
MSELDQYDYELPPELIAQYPAPRRDDARLLVIHRQTGRIEHCGIRDLPAFLRPRDCLVFNDTRVIPARLAGIRARTGGKWEGLYLGAMPSGDWRLIGQTRGRLQPGDQIVLRPRADIPPEGNSREPPATVTLTLHGKDAEGVWTASPDNRRPPLQLLAEYGALPLPPYIERDRVTAADCERYQTVFARHQGAVAAPTAGLHFTPELIARCQTLGTDIAYVTLHVGIGTFRPVSVDSLDEHQMHAEWCTVPEATARQLQQVRPEGRVIAVGTTSVRTLESAAKRGHEGVWAGETDLFIRPPYEFQAVDCLLTNFHLPRSTLLVLVSALAGRELIFEAYREAIARRYRFFSYGDAMLIL